MIRNSDAPAVAPAFSTVDREATEVWLAQFRADARTEALGYLRRRCAEHLGHSPLSRELAGRLLDYAARGKYVRSTFAYVGWLCGAADSPAAVRAAASLELLHTFALVQDDVMDSSTTRRGVDALHVQAAQAHRRSGLSGSAERFGESAGIVLADLCLIWSEQMLRESGLDGAQVRRALESYDSMRTELAAGQLDDLYNDARDVPSFATALDIARRKSGNYTVRRPLEIGAELAGCEPGLLDRLTGYGTAIGEAFQLRDDVLGIFGDPALTGKPADDLHTRKASTVVALADEMADSRQRRDLRALAGRSTLDRASAERWRQLIVATGARREVEIAIEGRYSAAIAILDESVPERPRLALATLAQWCTHRSS